VAILPWVRHGQGQKIGVGDLARIQQARSVYEFFIKQTDLVWPEFMAREGNKAHYGLDDYGGCGLRVEVSRISDDPQDTVFSQRACGPDLLANGLQPAVRRVVLDVRRIDQRNENIHVEQKPAHNSSSSSCFTSSEVTRGAPGRTGSSRIPLRLFWPEPAGLKAVRASAEMTSPTVFDCEDAISLAAANMSSSMAKVVLTNPLRLSRQTPRFYIRAQMRDA